MRRGQEIHFFSPLIIALVVAVYILSMAAASQSSFISASGVVYRGQRGGVALECRLQWNSPYVEDIMDALDSQGVKATFFVTSQWVRDNPELLDRLAGHQVGLLGSADGLEAQKRELEKTGIEPKLFMPYNDRDAGLAAAAARENGMRVVLATTDMKNDVTDPRVLARRMAGSVFDGAIIRFDPTAQMAQALPLALEMLAQNGVELGSVGDLMGFMA